MKTGPKTAAKLDNGPYMTARDPLSLVGSVLDRTYRIDSLVGEGGFGVVYRAFHLGFEELVAVKCLKIPGSLSPQTQDAFLRKFREEGKLLFQLSKGTLGIVRSIAVGDTTSPTGIWAPYFVLEWLEGESLADVLRARRAQGLCGRPLADVLQYLDRPARALAFAHGKRVAHRDIKPANLFVVRDDEPSHAPTIKVLDFGIAKAMEEGPADLRKAMTNTGFSSFTPQYAAPEQFDPNIGPTGPWTDVYGFALVVVEMLTDKLPVQGDDAISLMQSTLNPGTRPTPRTKGLDVSEPVERVFARALSVDPGLRFTDVMGFWDALKVASEGEDRGKTQLMVPSAPPPAGPGQMAPAVSMGSMPALPAMPEPPPNLAAVPTTGTASAPVLTQPPNTPVKRRVWLWVLFGIVVGIALIFLFGLLTCTTCVYSVV
ncbi:MAG: serine/threonine protein kinase [Myxococcota bacterium]